MPDDVITIIRRHDPAARLRPLPTADAAAMRDRVLRSAVPRTSSPGASEDAGGYDKSSLQATDREIAAAHHGDFTLIRQYLRANCGE